ncbi:Hypp6454 [Branchiostoma lanceolatum]|uniref:Hypp6454 protein n=1 Tax=Branchiostoma lanceolatum TaxID=7740 RepID=A0A8J9YUF5_BRALA|nr:Hypp6454 [Branchiostoma lanceolatum]
MGVLDWTASAFLTVVHTLSLLRPGGKRWTGEPKLNVTVHEGKVGRHSQSKYVVTLRHGKEKQQTKKKKSDGLVWEHAAVFSHWTPTDPLILKLRKAKRCKDATIAELPIDVAAALASVDGLPNRWWYAIERIDKGGRQKEEVFLQVTITVDGPGVKSGSTQVPAKPGKEAATTAAPETPRSTAVVESESSSTSGLTSSPPASFHTPDQAGTSGHGEGDVEAGPERHSRDEDVEVSQVPSTVLSPTDDKDSGLGQDPTRPTKKEKPECSAELKEVTTVSTDVEVAQVPAADSDSGRGQGPAKPPSESTTTVAQDKPSTKRGVEPSHGRRSSVSQEGETGTSDSSRRTDVSPPSAAGDITDVKSEQPLSSSLPPSQPASCDTPDQAGTRGRGEGDFKAGPERHSRDKDVEAPQVPSAVDGHTGDIDSGRGQDSNRPSEKTVMTAGPETPGYPAELKGVTAVSTDVEAVQVPSPGDGPTDPNRPPEKTIMTAWQENPEYSAELKEVTAVSTDVEAAQMPADVDSPVSSSDSERDQDPAKPSNKNAVQQKPEVSEDVMSLPENEETDLPVNADSDVDADRPKTASSTQGGGVDLPTTNPSPRHADADDPQYEEMMSSIDDLWDDLLTKREYADELQTYAESLRSKLAATAPHVLNYTIIKNLAAQVPVCKSYDLPQTEGLSLRHLKDIQDTLAKLLKDEENHAWYLRKWYIEEMCKVALKEAPQVLGAQD